MARPSCTTPILHVALRVAVVTALCLAFDTGRLIPIWGTFATLCSVLQIGLRCRKDMAIHRQRRLGLLGLLGLRRSRAGRSS